jgi:CMP-N-acetylneuraminic acid synthetase
MNHDDGFPSAVCLIPARGGSKRLPRKNIMPFFGHPMLAYAIAAARHSGLFDAVAVTTDDPDIGRIAEWYGALYIARPAELASDKADLVGVTEHALEECRSRGLSPQVLCQLMPNCPLRTAADIVAHGRRFVDQARSFQISVVRYRSVYPHWALVADHDGRGQWFFDRTRTTSSHDMEHVRCPTGAIWWVRVGQFLEQRDFYGDPYHLEEIDADRGIDIDREDELLQAEVVVHGLNARDGACPLEPVDQQPWDAVA